MFLGLTIQQKAGVLIDHSFHSLFLSETMAHLEVPRVGGCGQAMSLWKSLLPRGCMVSLTADR